MLADPMTKNDHRPRQLPLAALGLVLGVVGLVGYFVVTIRLGARFPSLRDYAVPSWILVALGLVLSILAVARARRRRLAGVLLGLNFVVSAVLAAFLFVFTALPAATGPHVGAPAPAFALVDQGGETVRLEDFRGAPLLLVFYRGHW
jgi:AhpC/TSA family protein